MGSNGRKGGGRFTASPPVTRPLWLPPPPPLMLPFICQLSPPVSRALRCRAAAARLLSALPASAATRPPKSSNRGGGGGGIGIGDRDEDDDDKVEEEIEEEAIEAEVVLVLVLVEPPESLPLLIGTTTTAMPK